MSFEKTSFVLTAPFENRICRTLVLGCFLYLDQHCSWIPTVVGYSSKNLFSRQNSTRHQFCKPWLKPNFWKSYLQSSLRLKNSCRPYFQKTLKMSNIFSKVMCVGRPGTQNNFWESDFLFLDLFSLPRLHLYLHFR